MKNVAKKYRGSEFEWITRLAKLSSQSSGRDLPSGAVGIGDDCARWPMVNNDLLLSCDSAVSGRHFQPKISPWDAVGWRLICANVSDILACGGTPLAALIAIKSPVVVADEPASQIMEAVYEGINQAAVAYDLHVVGGNLSRAAELIFDCFMLGEAKRFIARSGVQAGDWLALSGTLGEAEAGRLALIETQLRVPSACEKVLIQKWMRPQIPIHLATWLQRHAHAAIDISDGLSSELHHLAEASHLRLCIQGGSLSAGDQLRTWLCEKKRDVLQWLLHRGECWELLVAGSPKTQKSAEQAGLEIIGYAEHGTGVLLDEQPLLAQGFTHF